MIGSGEHLRNVHSAFFDRHPHLAQLLGDLLYVFLLVSVSMVLAVLAYENMETLARIRVQNSRPINIVIEVPDFEISRYTSAVASDEDGE